MKFYEIYYKRANSMIMNCDYELTKETTLMLNLDVALQCAALVSKCADVVGVVDVVDGTTGEIMATYNKGRAIYLSDAALYTE